MKRRVIQHGPSSLIVSLPKAWVKKNGVKKGDELEVVDNNNKLEIATHNLRREDSVNINVTGLNRTTILIYIQSMYRKGYEEINITFNNEKTIHYRKQEEVSVLKVIEEIITRFIGVEIVKQTRNYVQIKQISEDSHKNFGVLVKRVIYLTTEAFRELERCLFDSNHKNITTIEHHHKNITKFINYTMRLINKGTVKNFGSSLTLYHLLAVIDKIVDLLKEIERHKLTEQLIIPKEARQLVEYIIESMEMYQKFFLTKEADTADAIEEKRYDIKNELGKLHKHTEVTAILELLREIPELMQDLVECRFRFDPKSME